LNVLYTVLIVLASVGLAVGLFLLLRRFAPKGSFFSDGDRAAGVFGVLATRFSVLPGFVIFLAFTSYDTARSGARTEAVDVIQMYETAQLMPRPASGSTRPGRTGGCSATATAAPTCTSSPGPESSEPARQAQSVTRRPRACDYWAWRRRKVPLPINKTIQELTDAQDGRCSICGGLLVAVEDRPQNPREWEQWLATPTRVNTIATSKEAEPRLVHAECRHGHGLALHNAYEPSGLA
jgi:hypothetical protein